MLEYRKEYKKIESIRRKENMQKRCLAEVDYVVYYEIKGNDIEKYKSVYKVNCIERFK